MGAQRGPIGQFFIDNIGLSNDELRAGLEQAFPGAVNAKNFFNYKRRAHEAVKAQKPRKKPGPKPGKKKPKDSASARSRSPETFDPLETPDAKQLMNLLLHVGLNTAEVVIDRYRRIVEKTRLGTTT